MKNIFAKAMYKIEEKRDLMLVVITDNFGSAPRKQGSMMLVGKDGRIEGTIGGGAIEFNSEKMAIDLLKEKKSSIHKFTLSSEAKEDIGMICGGDVEVYFQYISATTENWVKIINGVNDYIANHKRGWLVLRLNGDFPSICGDDKKAIIGSEVNEEILGPREIKHNNCFSIPFPVGERVLIFGAGHIAKSLVPLLKNVGFRPVVYDCRETYAKAEYFPDAENVICGDFTKIKEKLEVLPDDFVLVMTNGHSFDLEVQYQILKNDVAYVGVVGSAKKTAFVNGKLHEMGISEEKTASIYTPVGLSIKAITPEEIAVSIVSQMILVRAERREKA